MDLGHRDARVIVTGGGANIGRGIVLGFAAEGARVFVADIDGPQAEAVAAQATQSGAADARAAAADLTQPDAAGTVIGQAVGAWGGVDVLVNNAGSWCPGSAASSLSPTSSGRPRWR
jgi:NAD(P)-dependent dehydrogenase (short-subunit alcohol dehydrogenase family)